MKSVHIKPIAILMITFLFLTHVSCTGDKSKKDETTESTMPAVTTIQNFSMGSSGNFNMKLLTTNQEGKALDCNDENEKVYLDIMNDNGEYERIAQENVEVKCNKEGQGQVAMVIDNTGSVKHIITEIKNGVNAVLNQVIDGEGSASITRVSTNSKICTEMISDETELRDTVENQLFAGNGWTALYDGIRMGNETLIRSDTRFDSSKSSVCGNMPNRGIIVFTDGNENNSSDEKSYSYDRSRFPGDYIDTSLEDLLAMDVSGIKVPIYTIGMGNDVDHETLEKLSSESGGRHFKVENGQEVEVAFDVISKYFNAVASVCAHVSKDMCGTRHIKITRENTESQSSETTTYTADIPCEKESTNNVATETLEIDQDFNSTDFLGSTIESNLTKSFYLPGFNNELGTKELTNVVITYDLNSTSALNSKLEYENSSVTAQSKTTLSLSSLFRYYAFEKNRESTTETALNLAENPSTSLTQNSLKGTHRVHSHDFYKFINVDSYKMKVSLASLVELSGEVKGSLIDSLSGKISVSYTWRSVENPKVKILDPGFEYLVRKLSGNKYGLISSSDVLSITKLDLSKRNLKSLEGLQFFTNLEEINLSKNSLSNISILGKLKKLRKVNIDENEISNINALSNLENLEYLSAKKNSISDLNALSSLTKLTSLYVSNNKISDISHLAKLINLKALSLSSNSSISDISTLKNLNSLTKLYLSNNKLINDFSVLIGLSNLYYLNLSGIKNITLSQFVDCPGLTTLVLNNSGLQDYSLLSKVTKLKTLYAKNNNLEDLGSFENLKVSYLNLSGNKITNKNWSSLNKISTLTHLVLDSNSISTVEGLTALTNLLTLSLKSNEILNLGDLSTLTSLRSLSISDNLISNLTAISSLANSLKYFYASKNKITDISILSKMTNLLEISLGDNFDLVNTEALSSLSSLVKVWLYNTLAKSFNFITSSEKLSYLNLLNTAIDCGIQKNIVSKQYEGLTAKYDLVTDCTYIYDSKSSGPTVTKRLETQDFEISQFNIFTVNAEQTYDIQNNSQTINFKPFNSALGTRKIVSAKLTYSLKANIMHSAFRVSTSESGTASLTSAHEITINPSFSSMDNLNAAVENTAAFTREDIYTLTEEELDNHINNPEQSLPYEDYKENILESSYSFTESEIVNLNNGQEFNLDILQSISGSLINSSHQSIHGFFNAKLSGSVKLELTVED